MVSVPGDGICTWGCYLYLEGWYLVVGDVQQDPAQEHENQEQERELGDHINMNLIMHFAI